MSWGLVAGAAATVVGGALSSDANRKAGNKANDATMASIEEQRRQFDLLRADQQPYQEAGVDALGRLRGLVDFDPTPNPLAVMSTPGYQFGLDQGRDAIQGTAAARGGLYSGQALKELTKFGSDYGTTKFDAAYNREQTNFGNRWGRLAALAGIGQTATQQTGAAGQRLAGAIGDLQTSNAGYQGAAAMNNANIWGSGINQLGGFAANRWGRPGASGGGGAGLGVPVDDSGNGWW
jgi:hypothetical protein